MSITEVPTMPTFDQESATKESYAGAEPYAYLYSLRSDAFRHQVLLDRMSEEAKKRGVTNFKKRYMQYVASLNASPDRPVGNVTDFTGQTLELYVGRWQADDKGISCEGDMARIEACTHPIMPIMRMINIDTDTEKTALWYKPGKTERTVIVDKSVLASPQSIIKLADRGIAVTSENAKALIKYLSDCEALNYDKIPEKRSVSRLGWIPKYGFSPYVDDLKFDGDTQYRAAFEAVCEHGKFSSWADIAWEARKNSQTARIMIAASFASALVEICGCAPFFVHLWSSESGTGKTVALMIAASVWANPVVGTYIQTFNSTVVGREKMAAFCNSLPLCIDELQLGKDSRGKQQFDVYALAEGVGRTRGTKSGGLERTSTWRNCILTTGETPITASASGAGALNRVVDIECKAGEVVVQNGRKTVEAIKKHYGHAGKKFIEAIRDNGTDRIRQMYQDYYIELMSGGTTEKQALAAALILTADYLVDEWVFGSEELIEWKMEQPLIGLLDVADMSSFLLTKAQVDVNRRAYDFMSDWVAANQSKFSDDTVGELYGAISGDFAYIIPSVFRKVLEDAGYSYDGFLGWCKANDMLQKDGSHLAVKRQIGKARVRCIALKIPDISGETGYFDV